MERERWELETIGFHVTKTTHSTWLLAYHVAYHGPLLARQETPL